MKYHEIYHHFMVDRIREVKGQGTLYELHHVKTNARLVYLASEDDNKLFSVAFKTIPESDQGVFHILEHSVLCGSDHYPVKEPFVELLKSSMNTFLNAMTYPDKTIYPVSSKNSQDFFNLMDVYLDAVFHPLIYTNKHIFMQEGWHYEMRDAEDQPIYKGVVFNEMKGSFSSVDTMIDNEMMRMLYPDNCYQYVSGGDPEAIVTLGYEDFLAQHRRFYHPANAIFYLEGHLDIDRALAKIDAYVGTNQTPGSFAEIPSQKAIANVTKTVRYGISEDESLENKTHIIFGKIVADYDEKQKMYAISLLSDYLTGSNDAVLKKAILDQGLAQDVSAILTDGIQQAYFTLALSNTNSDQKDAITAVVKETIEGLLAEGLNRELLESSLNNLEFAIRDVNEPKALMHNIMVLNAMLYGGDPLTYLDFTDMLKDLREALKTNYYEELLAEIFDDQVGVATLIMEPSKTYNSELARQEAERLAAIKASWDQDMIQSVIADNESLDHWQHTEDTKENLDKIPRLTLADIAPQIAWTSIDEREIDGVKVLIHPSDIPEITHLNVYFKLDIPDEETLLAIGFLPNMFGDLPTKRSLNDLIYDIKGHVGRLYFDMVTTSAPGDLDHADLYLVARCSVLNSKVQDAVRLIDEIIHETDLTEKRLIKQLLEQILDEFRNSIIVNGHRYAIRYAVSTYSQESAINEKTDGLDCYLYLQKLVREFDRYQDDLINKLETCRQTLTADRMLISVVTPQMSDDLVSSMIKPLIKAFKTPASPLNVQPLKLHDQPMGVEIPAGISYAGLGMNLERSGLTYHGSWKVLSTLLSYYYLWNEVRVKGGAYGTGFATGIMGNSYFYSYRDPHVHHSLEVFRQTSDFIRAFVEAHESIEPYIISTAAKFDPLQTPRSNGDMMMGYYLRGITYEQFDQVYHELISTSEKDLLRLADDLDVLLKDSIVCMIGSHEQIEECQDEKLILMNLGS